MERVISRNEPCPCGSGKKYKHCCGNLAVAEGQKSSQPAKAPVERFGLDEAMKRALTFHMQGDLQPALEIYGLVLQHFPGNFDALHMLGVIHGQLGDYAKALSFLLDAAESESVGNEIFDENLTKAILTASERVGGIVKIFYPDLVGQDSVSPVFARDLPDVSGELPLVSIVIPCYNHESYVVEAIRSVFSQTYPHIEIVIIDDGSRDRSVERVEDILGESPYPVKFQKRENRGAHVTLNECIDLASGRYVGVLNSDDRYLPGRVDGMVRLLTATKKEWGFSGVEYIDEKGTYIQLGQNGYADILMISVDRIYGGSPITCGFVQFNYAISTGNLFFTKELWKSLGGFSDYRYVHDWDFCLRALERESPAVLSDSAYDYRLHGVNTISESMERSKNEMQTMKSAWGMRNLEGISVGELRQRLIFCARQLALLESYSVNLIGRQRLIELAQGLLGEKLQ